MSDTVIDAIENAGEVALPVFMTLVEIGDFLKDHGDLIKDIVQAFEGGATKDQIRDAIRASMVTASDAVMEAELGPRP